MVADNRFAKRLKGQRANARILHASSLDIEVRAAILRSRVTLIGAKISSAGIVFINRKDQLHVRPRSSEHRNIENRRIVA